MTEKKTVALLCGGRSSEHPISLITAAGVLGAIDRTAYDVITIGITRDGRWYLTDEQQLAELTAGTRGTAEFPEGTQQVFLPMGAGDSRLTWWMPRVTLPAPHRWTLCSRCCTALSVRTAPCRVCWKWLTCTMWVAV